MLLLNDCPPSCSNSSKSFRSGCGNPIDLSGFHVGQLEKKEKKRKESHLKHESTGLKWVMKSSTTPLFSLL
jgi:hypothetical protein